MLESIALMNGVSQKMDYLQVRQRVLSQNITNSDTPGYQSMDIKKPDFKSTMGRYINPNATNSGAKLSMTTTTPGHVQHLQMLNRADTGSRDAVPYEMAPSKNGVNLEDQMMKSSTNAVDYQLMTNLYNKNLGLIRSAIK